MKLNQNRANAGAGNVVLPIQNFIIGSTNAKLITGSIYLDDSGIGFILKETNILSNFMLN